MFNSHEGLMNPENKAVSSLNAISVKLRITFIECFLWVRLCEVPQLPVMIPILKMWKLRL